MVKMSTSAVFYEPVGDSVSLKADFSNTTPHPPAVSLQGYLKIYFILTLSTLIYFPDIYCIPIPAATII